MKLVTGEEMRAMDRMTIEEYGLPGIVLMENAARGVADEIDKRYGPLTAQKIAVVCGKGNNGGDGFAVARHLAVRYLAQPTIWLVEPTDQSSTESQTNLEAARKFGIEIDSADELESLTACLTAADLIVDAILGTGVTGHPRPAAAAAIDAVNKSGRPVVSIDVPSGLDDSGTESVMIVKADCTITLGLPKLGLYLYPGAACAGDIVTVDISFPTAVRSFPQVKSILIDKNDIATWLPHREAGRDSNKGKFGSVGILAGSPGFLGAACLASEAAARTGSGLVTLLVTSSIFSPIMTRTVESVMIRELKSIDQQGRLIGKSAVEAVKLVGKLDALGFGCGIGLGEGVKTFVHTLLQICDLPLVIDADALTHIAELPNNQGAKLVSDRKTSTILTPHPGEMARLLSTNTKTVQTDRLKAVKTCAEMYKAVVILKGQATLIASPDGRLAVNSTGNPGMATGGSGDVLTGIVTTLLAQIEDPWKAASAAVYIHGLAGDIAAKEGGMAGLLASDIAHKIPAAIKACYVKS